MKSKPSRSVRMKKTIHPALNDIYAAVGCAYSLYLGHDPIKDDAYMADFVRQDIKTGDISNLAAGFTALLNVASRKLQTREVTKRKK